jgi:hypothetical protein
MSTTSTPETTIRGISFVQEAVLEVLNDLFDPAQVARGAALAKLDKPKKNRKKKTPDNDAAEPELSQEEKLAIADKAAADAKPFSILDAMVTPATKAEFGDYQVNAAMGLAKSVGMNPRYVYRLFSLPSNRFAHPDDTFFLMTLLKRMCTEDCGWTHAQDWRHYGRTRNCWAWIYQSSIQRGLFDICSWSNGK